MSKTPRALRRDPKSYRPCVGIMLINRDGLVFVGQRIDILEDAWQMPQGGIDDRENPRQCALRELHEEVGTDKAEIVAEAPGWFFYDLPADLAPRVWGGRWRGQRQKWFALRFTGTDADIDLTTHEPEFKAWRWIAPGDLPDLTVDFKRSTYAAVVKEFAPVAKKIAANAKRR